MDLTGFGGRSITVTVVKEDEPPRLAVSESGQLLNAHQMQENVLALPVTPVNHRGTINARTYLTVIVIISEVIGGECGMCR